MCSACSVDVLRRFLVVDKPCGLPSLGELADCYGSALDWCNRHAKRAHEQLLAAASPKKKKCKQGPPNLSLVNRLDADVSGVLVLAKGNNNRKLMMDKMMTRSASLSFGILLLALSSLLHQPEYFISLFLSMNQLRVLHLPLDQDTTTLRL